jgi:hypothetical protein
VHSTWERLVAFHRRLPPCTVPVLLIILVVLLGNIVFISGLEMDNPITWTSSISHFLCHITCGRPMIDPNVGYVTQALGHRAALDLLHGHLPWWNYFEGLGTPLLGEGQSAALFPLVLLFALPSGLLWFHVCLEAIAGVSTYFLARRLSIPVAFAAAGGMLFALNGTFAWLGNAVLNPICFLPMLLLGIEMIFEGVQNRSNRGWYVAAIALALSLYAGFPEVAYINGLFCGGWAAVRWFTLPREFRRKAAERLGLAALIGLLISLPFVVPFADFLKSGNVGSHNFASQAVESLPYHGLAMFFDPYVFGTIFSNVNVGDIWGGIGGYFTISVFALALLGLFGTYQRTLRIFLGAWTLMGLLGAFNTLDVRLLWNVIPLLKNSGFGRYIMSSCELSLILLAVFGIMDLATSKRAKRLFTTTNVVALVVLVVCAISAMALNKGIYYKHSERIILIGLDLVPFIAVATLLALGFLTRFKVTPYLVALLLVGESLVMFFVPTAESPKQITVDQAPITFLLDHQHHYRYLDFAVLYPNWGSEFGLNELSQVDLPFPEAFSKLLESQLYPGLTPQNQFTIHHGLTGIGLLEHEVVKHFKGYEDASVKYLMMPTSVVILPQLTKLGVTPVFEDGLVTIYRMPDPRPFFSTKDNSCTVKALGVNAATVSCPNGGTTLLRTELFMPGWHAYVNGHSVTIKARDGVYQTVKVPSGTSTVTFSFLPPHEKYSILLGLGGSFFLLGSWVIERRSRRHKPRHARSVNGFGEGEANAMNGPDPLPRPEGA